MGFIEIPPYIPECRSREGPVIWTSIFTKPLNIVTIAGVSSPYKPVSHIKAISDFNSEAFAFINGTSEGEPLSSSPSKNIETRTGNFPCIFFQALQASTNVIN